METLISNKEINVIINNQIIDEDDKELEAEIIGTALFKIENGKFVTFLNFKYTEYDDGVKEDTLTIEASMTFGLNASSITDISDLDIEKLVKLLDGNSVSVKVNGMEVWAEAFIDELD